MLKYVSDSAGALGRAVEWCRPGGWVLASTPNVAHWRPRIELLHGRWPLEESGTSALVTFAFSRTSRPPSAAGLEEVDLDAALPTLRNTC